MTSAAQTVLDELQRRGVRVERRGDKVHMSAAAPPPRDLVERVARHKREILGLLPDSSARPVVHFRPPGGPDDAWATLLGWPGETREALVAYLHERFPGAVVRP